MSVTADRRPPETGWGELPFIGGDVCLDFVNTAGGRTKARDQDRLRSMADAASWARAAGQLRAGEHDRLRSLADGEPGRAARALKVLCEQREALHAFLLAGVRGSPADPAARDRVQSWLRSAYQRARLSEKLHDEPWLVGLDEAGLDLVSQRLALAVGGFLASGGRAHVSECGRCSWLFLDTSPSRRRRWCSMAICGNRAKAERHHRRATAD